MTDHKGIILQVYSQRGYDFILLVPRALGQGEMRWLEAGQPGQTQGQCQEELSPGQVPGHSLDGTVLPFTDGKSEVQRGCTITHDFA